MDRISLDYENVCNEVSQLRKISSDLQALQSEARKTFTDISSYWEGTAANTFSVESERWQKELQSLENEAASLAALIQRVADEIREAELRALAAIQEMGGAKND